MTPVLFSCAFVSAEWIQAHGLRVCRVVPSLSEGAACGTQTGMCPHARAFVGHALAAPSMSAIVFTTTCDQMRRAAELVQRERRGPLFIMNVPATWQTPVAEQMYVDELRRFSRFLRDLGGHEPDSGDPVSSIKEPRASARAESCLVPLATCLPVPSSTARLAVAGGPLAADSPFHRQIEQAGATIVLDATDSGERMQPGPIDRERWTRDPLAELARVYLAMPSIHQRPNHRLFAWLKREIEQRSVQGLILRRYVWCDLWHAEARRITEEVGVPVLDLQVDGESDATDACTASRIGSFIEMIGRSARLREKVK